MNLLQSNTKVKALGTWEHMLFMVIWLIVFLIIWCYKVIGYKDHTSEIWRGDQDWIPRPNFVGKQTKKTYLPPFTVAVVELNRNSWSIWLSGYLKSLTNHADSE